MSAPAHPQQWTAPDGVHLLHNVSIETLAAQGALHYVRARVTLPEFAKANVRTEGRRVYVDLTWPLDSEDPRAPRRMTAESGAGTPESASRGQARTADQKAGEEAPEQRYRTESSQSVSRGRIHRGAAVSPVRGAVGSLRRLRGARSDVCRAGRVTGGDERAAVGVWSAPIDDCRRTTRAGGPGAGVLRRSARARTKGHHDVRRRHGVTGRVRRPPDRDHPNGAVSQTPPTTIASSAAAVIMAR